MHRAPRAACALAFACACGFSTGTTDTDAGTGADTGPADTGATTGAMVLGECPDTVEEEMLWHSYVGDDGQCYCADGHTWVDPFNPGDFACTEVVPRTAEVACDPSAILVACTGTVATCDCAVGARWCSVEDTTSTRCCDDAAQQRPAVKDSETDASSSESGAPTTGADTGTTSVSGCG